MTSNRPLYVWILAGLLVGVAGGISARAILDESAVSVLVTYLARPIGTIWMRLILMTVVPMVFCALAAGAAGLRQTAALGRVGLRTLAATVLISSAAVALGLTLVNTFRPGEGLSAEGMERLLTAFRTKGEEHVAKAKTAKSVVEILVDLVPQNPIEEAATALSSPRGGMLAVMLFSLVFGFALARTAPDKAAPVLSVLEGTFEILMKVIAGAMKLAPLGVAALMFSTSATLGLEFLVPLAKYVAVVIAGLLLHQFGVYAILLRFVIGMSPLLFFKRIQEVMMTAFSTASSNATLPTTLEVAQARLGIPREIATFVLTLGSTANQNGTALFEGITVLFLAQFFGIELSLGQQISVVLMSILAGVGTAGVPGGSLPMIVIVLESVGIPGEGIAVILGVDRILDMCRTTVNVTGDLVITAYVARSEGHAVSPTSR